MRTLKITNGQLAATLTNMLTDSDNDAIDDYPKFCEFMSDIAKVVTKYAGGELVEEADVNVKATRFSNRYLVTIDDADTEDNPINASNYSNELPTQNLIDALNGLLAPFELLSRNLPTEQQADANERIKLAKEAIKQASY